MNFLRRSILQFLIIREYSSQVPQTAVIKVPAYVKKHVNRLNAKKEERRLEVLKRIVRQGNTEKPVITSNKKEYNFYLGQVYNNNFPLPIISKYWMKNKSAGQKFTIMPWDKNPSLPMKIENPTVLTQYSNEQSMSYYRSEFHQLDLSPEVVDALATIGYKYPTPIQADAIPKIVSRSHTMCVAETGSGKTMSYIAPIVDYLMQHKDKEERYPNTPLSLIITPGRELAEQIALAAYQLSQHCNVNVRLLVAGGTQHSHLKPVHYEPMDIVVTTFGLICGLTYRRKFNLSHLKHLVFDEADTLLDESFRIKRDLFMRRIMSHSTIMNPDAKDVGTQMIFASATVPRGIHNIYDNGIEKMELKKAVSPYINRVLPHIPQKFIRVNADNKVAILLGLVKNDTSKNKPVLVFCNKYETCNWLSDFLQENDVPHAKFHADLTNQERAEAYGKFQSGEVDVLCCTDLASRGLDTQRAQHVINYDFPNNASDYILRVGRIGRVGSNHGHVTSLIITKSSVHVLQDIEVSVRKWTEIDNVDADISRKIKKLYLTH